MRARNNSDDRSWKGQRCRGRLPSSWDSTRWMRQRKNDSRENRGVHDQRSALRSRRPQRFVELQKMDRRAVCRRSLEMSGDKKVRQVFSNTVQPEVCRCFVSGIAASRKVAQKWLAHTQAPLLRLPIRPEKKLGGGHQSASQKSLNEVWLPAQIKVVKITEETTRKMHFRCEQKELIQAERYFDRHNHRHNLAARSSRGSEAPGAHGFDSLLSESHSGILHDGYIHRAAVSCNRHL